MTGDAAAFLVQVKLCGRIGESDSNGSGILASNVQRALAVAQGARALSIVIDSDGGLFSEAEKIHRLILEHPAPDKTAIVRNASCAATYVMLACTRRWARPGARILLHRIAAPPCGLGLRWTAALHQEVADNLRREDEALARLYAARTGGRMSARWFLQIMQGARSLTMAEALACGLIHKILPASARSETVDVGWGARADGAFGMRVL